MNKAAAALASLALLAACAADPPARAPGAPGRGRAKAAHVLILSTMLADRGLGEWGFAALVTVDGRQLLFDTGAYPDTVLKNAQTLGVDLSKVEEVVLSHNHGDHTGGLATLRSAVLAKDARALSKVHVGAGIFLPRRGDDPAAERNPMVALRAAYEATGGAFVEHDSPVELWPGVWLTGTVPRVYPERNWSGKGELLRDGAPAEDTLPEDMSLVIDTDAGLVVVSGCGHAGIVNTLEHARRSVRDAKIHAAIGGFHLFEADAERLAWTGRELRERGIENLIAAHCTGIEATYVLREKAGLSRKTCVVGAVGASFTLGRGIDPKQLAK